MVKQDQYQRMSLIRAREKANIDSLTGIKNKHAYSEYEAQINKEIESGKIEEFAIIMTDINDLKEINDTFGHKAGDDYLKKGCEIICRTFAHSPVFRIGGDEFTVVAKGDDYQHLNTLAEQLNAHNKRVLKNNRKKGLLPKEKDNFGVVISFGIAKYNGEQNMAAVFEKADQAMYDTKREIKRKAADAC